MDWSAAKDDTLRLWTDIRRKIPQRDSLELLSEINAVCSLCEVAQASSPRDLGRCERCLAYRQFGGCRGINAEMSERIATGDWPGFEALVDDFIAKLEAMDVPRPR